MWAARIERRNDGLSDPMRRGIDRYPARHRKFIGSHSFEFLLTNKSDTHTRPTVPYA